MAAVKTSSWLEGRPTSKTEWVRVTDFAPYVATEDLTEEEDTYALARRVYRPKGRRYPLLQIAVHAVAWPVLTGVRVTASFKPKKVAWWSDADPGAAVPLSLFGDLFEMLREAETKLQNLHACA